MMKPMSAPPRWAKWATLPTEYFVIPKNKSPNMMKGIKYFAEIGTGKKIKSSFKKVDEKLKLGFNFFTSPNPFGDGKASQRIIKIIKESIS